jgi:hypothetical protein
MNPINAADCYSARGRSAAKRTRERKKRFDAAHAKGMKALHDGDYNALDEAIREEREIVKENARLLAARSESLEKRKTLKGTKRRASHPEASTM